MLQCSNIHKEGDLLRWHSNPEWISFDESKKQEVCEKCRPYVCRGIFTVFLKNSSKVFYFDYSVSIIKNKIQSLTKDNINEALDIISKSTGYLSAWTCRVYREWQIEHSKEDVCICSVQIISLSHFFLYISLSVWFFMLCCKDYSLCLVLFQCAVRGRVLFLLCKLSQILFTAAIRSWVVCNHFSDQQCCCLPSGGSWSWN